MIVLPSGSYDKLLDLIAYSDAGIIIYDDSVMNNIYCEPGKLSDYVFAHIPIISPNFPTVGPIIKKFNIGIVFNNSQPESIAHAILEIIKKPREEWDSDLFAASKELTWEKEFTKLILLFIRNIITYGYGRNRVQYFPVFGLFYQWIYASTCVGEFKRFIFD